MVTRLTILLALAPAPWPVLADENRHGHGFAQTVTVGAPLEARMRGSEIVAQLRLV